MPQQGTYVHVFMFEEVFLHADTKHKRRIMGEQYRDLIDILAKDPKAIIVIHGPRQPGPAVDGDPVRALDKYAMEQMGRKRVIRQRYPFDREWVVGQLERKLDKSAPLRIMGCGEQLTVCANEAAQELAQMLHDRGFRVTQAPIPKKGPKPHERPVGPTYDQLVLAGTHTRKGKPFFTGAQWKRIRPKKPRLL